VVDTVAVDEGGPREYATSASPLAVGVIVWLASEVMFFAGLFAAWFVLRSQNDPWPPDGAELDLLRAAIFTAVLVTSSFTMHVAVKAGEEGDDARSARWLGLTWILGASFLINLVTEWAVLDFQLDTDAYGTIFYLLTGFHGLHVLGGLVLMVAVGGAVLGRSSRAQSGPPMAAMGYYWHFVDVVWIVLFLTVYVVQ
jgi:cytochrome c oxidase subunit 3